MVFAKIISEVLPYIKQYLEFFLEEDNITRIKREDFYYGGG